MDLKFFKEIPFFSHLSKANLQLVSTIFEQKSYKKGDVIIWQGEPPDGMYIIMFGEVEVKMNGKKIAKLGNNDFFGEIALITPEPRTASIQVTSNNCSVFYLSKEAFDNIKKELSPNMKKEVLRRIKENFHNNKESKTIISKKREEHLAGYEKGLVD